MFGFGKSAPDPVARRPGVIVGVDGGTIKRDRDGYPVSQRGGVPLTDRSRSPVIQTGPMGSGKTQIFYATLMDAEFGYTHSAVLWDYKRALCDEVGKARELMGQNVLVVDITRRGAGRVNPMSWVREGDRFTADIQMIAGEISQREEASGGSQHWVNAAYSYMVGVIAYLLTSAPDSEKCLAGVRRHMIRGDRGSTEMIRHGVDPLALEAAEELWTKSMEWDGEGHEFDEEEDKSSFYRKAIYTSASVMLTDFSDEVLASQTAVSDFDPGDLVSGDKPLTVIISSMPSDARRLRRVYTLIYKQIVDLLTENRTHVCGMPRRWDVLLGIDEFLEFRIKEVSSWIKYLREYGVRPVFLAQSFESVIEMYQRVIASSAIWTAFAPMSIFEADLMSRMIGDRDEVVKSESRTKKNWFETASVTESTRLERRPEKTASDLMDMSKDELFVFGLGKTINAQCCFAFSRYPDAYGPASRNWTSPISSNPWHGRFLPVPPPKPKDDEEEEDGKQEKTGKQIDEPRASLNTKSLMKGIRK